MGENITKLVRANRFQLDTVLYKVGEDAISDAFSRAADASDSSQVVLIFPTLAEELQNGGDDGRSKPMAVQPEADKKKPDDNERDKLKSEWLDLLFTNKSVAAQSPEGPLPVTFEAETSQNPNSLCVWIGDQPEAENDVLKALPSSLGGSASFMCISWSRHPAGEGLMEFNLNSTEVTDGVWYLRERSNLENEDLTCCTMSSCLADPWLNPLNRSLRRP